MRPFKFRILDSHHEYVTHDAWGLDNPELVISLDGKVMSYSEGYGSQEYKNCTIQQFIGEKDKKGTDIYEGDLITIDLYEEGREPSSPGSYIKSEPYEVYWDNDSCAFKCRRKIVHSKNIVYMDVRSLPWTNEMEVIKGEIGKT